MKKEGTKLAGSAGVGADRGAGRRWTRGKEWVCVLWKVEV